MTSMIMSHLRKLRQVLPVETEYDLRNACATLVPVRHRSRYNAVFHTCVWKTASQWVRVVLSDPRLYMYSGLKTHIPIGSERWWPEPSLLAIPERNIVPGLYCDYSRFANVHKPAPYAVFFVQRDPRDIMISWYFSNRYSHRPRETVNDRREALAELSERDGILATVDQFDEIAGMLRSWAAAAEGNQDIRIVQYEDLTGPAGLRAWAGVLAHCDIMVPDHVLKRILNMYAFVKISGGRKPGEEDKSHKYRKGIPGDWKNYFDAEIERRFYDRHGNLPEDLGYS